MSTAVRAKARSGQKKQVETETTSAGSHAASLPRVVFEGIVRGLYEGRYVAGQRLVEADIVQTFDVSCGSVREALNRLAAEGTVVLEPHRGARIRLRTTFREPA